MKELVKLNVQEMISVSPSKVCRTVSISKSYKNSLGFWELKEKSNSKGGNVGLKKEWHNMELSKNSQRNLREKVEWLFQFAKSRNVKTYTNKIIKAFKVGFITLTLPSKQQHNTAYIITQMLDEFLQHLRKRIKMINYVWRLEFQSNGNAHFHIVTDSYVDYYLALKIWNKILDKNGYIQPYSDKMSQLSFNDYCIKYGKNYKGEKLNKSILFKRYEAGRAMKWRNPNTVDCKNVSRGGSISYYLSKYFSKKEKGAKKNELDNEQNSFALRLCFWSRSLSKCKGESMPTQYYDINLFELLKNEPSVTVAYYDYCAVIYYDYEQLSGFAKEILHRLFIQYKVEADYRSAG